MKLSQQVKPISYLKAHASELMREVCKTHSPIIITQNGEAKTVLQDLKSYESTQNSVALLKILVQSRKSKEAGKFRSASEAFDSINERIRANQ